VNYLFDTSALVAHAFAETGGAAVQALIADEEHDLFIASISLFELAGVLKENDAVADIPAYWQAYCEIAEVIPADADIARAAWQLREKIGCRLPIADAIIAATAQSIGATLVHADQHLAKIPESLIPQIRVRHHAAVP